MKRTTATTHRYDKDGKLIETIVHETVEDDATPNTSPWGQPYTYPHNPYTYPSPYVTYTGGYGTVQNINGALSLVQPDDDDGTAGVPAIA